MEIEIRPLKESDIDECVSMAMNSFGTYTYPKEQFDTMKEEFRMGLQEPHWAKPNYFVCTINNIVVGMAGYVQSWLDWDTFEFFWLCVRKEYKNKFGIGKMLVEHREKEVIKKAVFKNDITIMFSCTNDVIEYHERHGYNILLRKAAGKEVIMGKTFLKK